MERIYSTKVGINLTIDRRRIDSHIERYLIIKRYCFGNVLDIACGVGYGCYILENNPDINNITGVDIDKNSIDIANKEFSSNKIKFEVNDIKSYSKRSDVLVSLETIEHIPNLTDYVDMVNRVDPKVLILSFPNKKSTHFNKFHKHDLNSQEIVKLFKHYVLVKQIYQHDISIMIFTKLQEGIPNHLFDTIQ